MTETEKLLSHLTDLKEKSANESVITTSNFLSIDELSAAFSVERINNQYVDTFYYGGYDEAERKIAVFVPKFYNVTEDEIEKFLDETDISPIHILCVKKDKFSNLTHRDYLGALMGLGIKREVIGDIVINGDGCHIFCLKSISKYITENLKQAGRGQLNITIGNTSDFYSNHIKTETVFVSVASMRLDCLVAAVFNQSRTKAVEAINQGLVYVNSLQCFKTDITLKKGDKLVLRGKGKSVIDEILGENKKGRIHLNIKRYL